jgi:hypothetical protein
VDDQSAVSPNARIVVSLQPFDTREQLSARIVEYEIDLHSGDVDVDFLLLQRIS